MGPSGRTADRRGPNRSPAAPAPPVGCRESSPIAAVVANGARLYDRERMLPRLLPLAVAEVAEGDLIGLRRICALIARALRAERTRGRAGHWSYDLNRHIGLLQAFRAERTQLAALERTTTAAKRRSAQ